MLETTETKNTRRALVVEDETLVAFLLIDMLEEYNVEVVAVAHRFDEAVGTARSATVDLAIIDVNLHGQKTYPIADILKTRNVPFAFATGYDADHLHEQYQDYPVLRKPFEAGDLSALIEHLFMR